MPWRLIFIGSLMLTAVIGNGAMLWFERIDPPAEVAALQDNVRAVTYLFIPSRRKANFTQMGLGDKVDAAVDEAARVAKNEARLRSIAEESADQVAGVFCPGGRLPPRFAALSLLVQTDGKEVRRVLRPARVTAFSEQEWYAESLTEEVYGHLEVRENPSPDAAAVGVAAVLAAAEVPAIAEEAPFDPGFGGTWGLDEVFEEYGWVELELVRYFAFMHVMAEIARSENGGICK